MSPSIAPHVFVHRLAGLALGGWHCPIDEPLDERAWKALKDELELERLRGLLVGAVADHGLPVTKAQEHEVAALETELVGVEFALGRAAAATVAALHAAGIDHRVVKGLALARLDYPDSLWRSSGDVDLLVPAPQFEAAFEAVAPVAEWVSDPALFEHEARSFVAVIDGVEIDVHRRLVWGPIGHLASEGLFESSRPLEIEGCATRTLGRELTLLHACINALSNEWYPKPRALLDVALLASAGPLDLSLVREVVRHWQVGPLVGRAVRLAAEMYDCELEPLASQLDAIRPGPRARSVLWIDDQRRRTYTTRLLAEAYISSEKWRGRLEYLAATAGDGSSHGLAVSTHPIKALRRYRRARPDTTRDPRAD